MKNIKLFILLLGVAVILFAPLLGNMLAACYLRLSGGMETEKFLLMIEGSIRSFQTIGTLTAVYAMFGRKYTND